MTIEMPGSHGINGTENDESTRCATGCREISTSSRNANNPVTATINQAHQINAPNSIFIVSSSKPNKPLTKPEDQKKEKTKLRNIPERRWSFSHRLYLQNRVTSQVAMSEVSFVGFCRLKELQRNRWKL